MIIPREELYRQIARVVNQVPSQLWKRSIIGELPNYRESIFNAHASAQGKLNEAEQKLSYKYFLLDASIKINEAQKILLDIVWQPLEDWSRRRPLLNTCSQHIRCAVLDYFGIKTVSNSNSLQDEKMIGVLGRKICDVVDSWCHEAEFPGFGNDIRFLKSQLQAALDSQDYESAALCKKNLDWIIPKRYLSPPIEIC